MKFPTQNFEFTSAIVAADQWKRNMIERTQAGTINSPQINENIHEKSEGKNYLYIVFSNDISCHCKLTVMHISAPDVKICSIRWEQRLHLSIFHACNWKKLLGSLEINMHTMKNSTTSPYLVDMIMNRKISDGTLFPSQKRPCSDHINYRGG